MNHEYSLVLAEIQNLTIVAPLPPPITTGSQKLDKLQAYRGKNLDKVALQLEISMLNS